MQGGFAFIVATGVIYTTAPDLNLLLTGEKEAMHQVLDNLVSNAIRYTHDGGHIRICLKRAHKTGIIEVEDTGVGIAPEVLPRLFDTFFSTKEGGSGLGLALTQQIVKDHGGDLTVESTVGKGTTFTVSIPRG